MMTSIEQLVETLLQGHAFADRVAHYRYLEAQAATWHDWAEAYPAGMQQALRESGITQLFSHQAEALAKLRGGAHTGITTPTASGKTLIYNLAVCEKLLQDQHARALYLFPLKALAQDQLKTLQEFLKKSGLNQIKAAIYDGDTPDSTRAKLRKTPPQILLTNPDMLHFGMLAYPQAWMKFYQALKFIVIDEAHTYRGIFGSHVALILRRLRRLCPTPGPTVVASSATMANAKEFLETLTGLPFTIIEKSGAPRPGRHVILMNPIGSAYSEAAGVLRACLEQDVKTIVFTKSRKITELIHMWVREASPKYAEKIAAYRAGYLPEERRKIEQELFQDRLSAVITTSALEAGIDVGGLDAAILVGYPGTMISTWQRVGRAGRGERDAVMVLIALPDALDHYFLAHPDAFFKAKFENCVLDPANPHLLRSHLPCAAAEAPLTPEDADIFGTAAWSQLPSLVQERVLNETADGSRYLAAARQPHRGMDIRAVGEQYVIRSARDGAVLGSVDGARVFKECHPGAIYLQAGLQYEVVGLDLDMHTVMVQETAADWYTQYTSSESIEIMGLQPGEQILTSDSNFQAGLVNVRVTEKIVAYERHRVRDQSLLSEHKLDLPERVFETQAVLITIPAEWRKRCLELKLDFSGGLHAVEHSLIAALPIQVLCDRWDLGGLSTLLHFQVNQPCIFVYEGHAGGLGLAAKGLAVMTDWLAATLEIVESCECEDGCPACIHSPKCGSRNHPLDKQACRIVLKAANRDSFKLLQTGIPKQLIREQLLGKTLPVTDKISYTDDQALTPIQPQEVHLDKSFHMVVFDLETQRSAADVGGWDKSHLMGMSLGVVYDHQRREYITYRESEVQALIQHLLAADLVVGFNINRFDLAVLSAYSPHVNRIKTFDILSEIQQVLGYRLSLDHLAKQTLGRGKTAEGLQAIAWFQAGQWQELAEYCRMDVEITRDILFFALKNQYLLYERQGVMLKLPVQWHERLPQISIPE